MNIWLACQKATKIRPCMDLENTPEFYVDQLVNKMFERPVYYHYLLLKHLPRASLMLGLRKKFLRRLVWGDGVAAILLVLC